jgi:hypothetical protein
VTAHGNGAPQTNASADLFERRRMTACDHFAHGVQHFGLTFGKRLHLHFVSIQVHPAK